MYAQVGLRFAASWVVRARIPQSNWLGELLDCMLLCRRHTTVKVLLCSLALLQSLPLTILHISRLLHISRILTNLPF